MEDGGGDDRGNAESFRRQARGHGPLAGGNWIGDREPFYV